MTYCDFKPGDEVVCIAKIKITRAPKWMFWARRVCATSPFGDQVLTVADVTFGTSETFPECGETAWLRINGWGKTWFAARAFRKVQRRRDLSAWLETATDFEEPKRAPVDAPVSEGC